MTVAGWICCGITSFSVFLYLLMVGSFLVVRARAKWRRRGPPLRSPRVSVLKPLAGTDDELRANLVSFAAVAYPEWELLLGVASADDPAYDLARRFVADHPELDARVVLTDAGAAINPKVAQLLGLERVATGAVIVISDSNVRVRPSYLSSMVRELDTPEVGLVTSEFAGTGERTLGAALENLQLGALIGPSVAASTVLTRRPVTVGKSMAMRRADATRLEALQRVADVLAEDHILGGIVVDAGMKLAVSEDIVENRNVSCSVRRTFERHVRWAKMRRCIVPVKFTFEPLLYPVLSGTAAFLVAPCAATLAVGLGVASLQVAGAWTTTRMLRGHWMPLRYLPVELARSFVVFACWIAAVVTRRVTWRGHEFVMGKDSRIAPVSVPTSLRATI